jgi:hypothetical protein
MSGDVAAYFEETVIPLLTEKHPDVAPEMSVLIRGSFGLGIADEFSDLDAIIYLEDELWKAHGGHVQLTLEREAPRFTPYNRGHCEICVYPFSWLLHGRGKEFSETGSDPPWEKATIEELYELQQNLVLRDPHGLFRRLREATAPERFPAWLWKKRLITLLSQLDADDLVEYRQTVRRGRRLEGVTLLGLIVQCLLRLGFIINRRYYPWRTRLSWAFQKLPPPAPQVLPHIEATTSSCDARETLASIEAVRDIYREHIREKGILPPPVLDDLAWAERLHAWSDPHWRDWVIRCQEKARQAGYDPRHSWIWSLWGWAGPEQ